MSVSDADTKLAREIAHEFLSGWWAEPRLVDAIATALAEARRRAFEEAALLAERAEAGMDGEYCDSCHSVTYSPWRAAQMIRALAEKESQG